MSLLRDAQGLLCEAWRLVVLSLKWLVVDAGG